MSIIDLTTGSAYATVSAAIQASNPNDIIAISAGLYVEDFPAITHALTLEGVGGLAQLTTPGSPVNGKGILVIRADVTLRSLDLSGAAVPDGNGAGIRQDSGNLVVEQSHIHDNQDGILANGTSVTVRNSEIDHNGAYDGLTHNIYTGSIDSLVVENSYIHDALIGHEIKSRALSTTITGNRIQDQDSPSSFSIDLPNGGRNVISNNVLQKGPNTENQIYIHFGGELYPTPAGSSLLVSDNTFINGNGTTAYGLLNATNSAAEGSGAATPALVTGNTFYGVEPNDAAFDLYNPPDVLAANVFLPASSAPALNTASAFDVPEPGTLAVVLLAVVALRLLPRPARYRRSALPALRHPETAMPSRARV